MLLDSDYLLMGLPPLALAVWAEWRMIAACQAGRLPLASGTTGADAARCVLESAHVPPVPIEAGLGQLANYYDPAHHVLRLAPGVSSGSSVAAVGIAAHEAGHVLQRGSRFPWLALRGLIVSMANLTSTLFWILVLAGLFLGMFRLIIWSVFMLWFGVVLQLVNLPAEVDASRRAGIHLEADGIMTPEESSGLRAFLRAVCWTHVGGALTDVWPLRRLLAAAWRVA